MDVQTDHATDGNASLSLARRHRLTFYDAAYLEPVIRTVHPLATLDRDLIKAARADGVALISTP
jgi:predicted nucleic acid-binding protein